MLRKFWQILFAVVKARSWAAKRFGLVAPAWAMILLASASIGARPAPVPRWSPIIGPPAGAKYVGEKVCATCHVEEAKTYSNAPMAHAGSRPPNVAILLTHPRLTFQFGPYHYLISTQNGKSIYSVTDGKNTISEPVVWAFGMPVGGQTYMLRLGHAYYESRVSYFTVLDGLGITIGDSPVPPTTLEKAFGKRQSGLDARLCISCHTTGAVMGGAFRPAAAVPGVSCEACHGPGGQHVADVNQGNLAAAKAAIFNPGSLQPYALDDFCGSCHRTWAQVIDMQIFDIRNVRFQPYRLQKSACWSATDPRISCLACHNPHQPLVQNAAFYDTKCLACHQEKGSKPLPNHPGAACPVSTHNCTTCHMPQYKLPGSHLIFADHYIRVVKPGAPYPG